MLKIQELLETLQSKNPHDPKIDKLLNAVANETLDQLDPKSKSLVLSLVISLMELREQDNEIQDEAAAAADDDDHETVNKENDECLDLSQVKILPDDTPEAVRAKQAKRMKCYMDESVDPCERFYSYACGSWEKYHPIPRDRQALFLALFTGSRCDTVICLLNMQSRDAVRN